MESITAYLNRRITTILGSGILENVIIDSIVVTEQVDSTLNKDGLILEAKVLREPVPGIKHYSYRIDKQQGEGGPGRQRHIHLYKNDIESFAMNVDATAHDGYHQVRIPDDLVPFLKSKGFSIPDNNIIELKQYNSAGQLLCEDVDCGTLNDIVFNVTSAIRQAHKITIFEANVETYQVIWHSQLRDKYQHVNKLAYIPQERITEIKFILIAFLKSTGKYIDDVRDIFDSSNSPSNLFVAWSYSVDTKNPSK